MRSLRLRLALFVAVLGLLLAGCGDDDDGERQASRKSTRRSTTTAESATSTAPDDNAPQTVTSTTGDGRASPPAPAGSAGEPTLAESAAAPAAAGRYDYDVKGSVTFSAGGPPQTRPLPETATLTIAPPDGRGQTSVRESRDDEGNGSVTETVLVYEDDGVHLAYLKTSTSAAGITDTREFRPSPPPLLIPAGAAAGDHREFTMTSTDGRITVHVTVDVRGVESVAVAGTSVDALVVDIVSELSGDVEGTQRSRIWIDRQRSLTVKEHAETDARAGLGEVHSEYDATIRRLTPG